MKQKKKRSLVIIFVSTILLTLSGIAAYVTGLILPDPDEIAMQKNLSLLEKIVQDEGIDSMVSFRRTLAKMSESTLLATIAEAAEYCEENKAATYMVVYADSAVNKLGLSLTPLFLEEILSQPAYCDLFKQFMIEVAFFFHNIGGVEGVIRTPIAYTQAVSRVLQNSELGAEIKEYLIAITDFEPNEPILLELLISEDEKPNVKRQALEKLSILDSFGMQNQLFKIVDNYRQYDEELLWGAMLSLRRSETRESGAKLLQLTMALLEDDQRSYSDSFVDNVIIATSDVMGATHEKGLVVYLKDYTANISDIDYVIMIGSTYLYPEIDELLLSDDPVVVDWAMDWIERTPFVYYLDTLEMVALNNNLNSKRAAKLAELVKEEMFYPPRADLATKKGNWWNPVLNRE